MANLHTRHVPEPIFREQYQFVINLFTALNAAEPIEEIVRQLALAFSPTIPFTRFKFSLAPWGWHWVVNEHHTVRRLRSTSKNDVAYQTVMNKQQSLLCQNLAEEPEFPNNKHLLKEGLYSVLIVPICAQKEAVGAFHFLHTEPNTYTKTHLHQIEALIPSFASAVVQLRNRLETEAMHKVSQTLRQTHDLNTLSTHILKHICDQGYDRVRIYLYDKKENELVGLVQAGGKPVKPFNGRRLPIAEDIRTQQTFAKKEPQIYKYVQPVPVSLEITEKRINTTNSEWAEFPLMITENNEEHIVGKISLDNAITKEPLAPARLQRLTPYMNHAASALHNARLYKQASEQTQNLTLQIQTHAKALEQQSQLLEDKNRLLYAFEEIGRSLLTTLNLNEILDILSVEIVKVSAFKNMMVALVDDEHQFVEVVRRVHTDPLSEIISQISLEGPLQYDLDDPNITAEVARTGKMQIIEGWDDRFDRNVSNPKELKDRAAYFIPIKKDNHVLAVLATGSLISEKPAMMASLETIHPLLDQVAVAIEHAHLHHKHQKTIAIQTAFITIGSTVQTMTRVTDIETVLKTCLHELISLGLNICSMGIHRVIDADQNLIETFRIDQSGAIPGSGEHTHRSTLTNRWKNRETIYVENLASESDTYVNTFRARLNNHPILSFVDIPFARGILSVHSTQKNAFSQHDQKILQEAADLISVGFARLEDLEQKENQTRQQKTLLTIGNAIQKFTRSENIETVLQTCLNELTFLGLDICAMAIHRILDANQNLIETFRIDSNGIIPGSGTRSQRPAFINRWKNNKMVYIEDLETEHDETFHDENLEISPKNYVHTFRSRLNNHRIHSFIDIPFTQGILRVLSTQKSAFSQHDQKLIQEVAHLIAIGFARLKDLESLENSNTQLQIHAAEMERFTYTVSHDLKSPLITIRGYLGHVESNAQKGNLEYVSSDLARIDKAATHMGNLLDDLLELSRIGRIDHLPEVIPLTDLAQQACDMLTGTIETHRVNIHIEPNLPHIFGDKLRLLEVMQNLIENAIKFMGEQPKPHIKIGVRTDAELPTCYVQDNGIGIDPRYHNKIFGLFDKLSKNTDGTGIGLALVHRILQHHEQKIWVESEGIGKGSTFCFTLPLPKKSTHNKG